MPFRVLVVGGAGGMGRWCASLFKSVGFDVSISSRRDASGVARSLGVRMSRPEDAGAFDIIVLSVPIDAIEKVASQLAPGMKPGSLLMDLSSLKKKPVESMLRHAPPGVEVIGAHPLFGPDSDGRGRTLVLVPTGRSERWFSVIRGLFKDAGFNVLEATAEQHDENMAVVQGLTHFMYVAMGRALEKSRVDLDEASAFRTPVYGITRELLGRVLAQSPELYALIQSSEHAGELRRTYIEACEELALELDAGDIDGFIRDFRSARRYYGDTEGAKKRSERILQNEMEPRLSIMDAVGKERAFDVGGKAVYGIVKETGAESFVLEAQEGQLTLKYEDVSPISGKALEALKAGMEPFISRDIMVKMPIGADPSVLKWVLSKIDGVRCVDFEATDAPESDFLLCRFAISVPASQSEDVLQRVLKTVWSLGLEVK
jgi:prephenate dehydrogenase